MLRVGLTGGIGSGKSTVAARLAEHGAVVVDADRVARAVVEPGTPGLAAIAEEFGPGVITDGALDRPRLAGIVFTDDAARQRLNAIVHPLVRARTAELVAAAPPDSIVVQDVPLLVENGMGALYHLVIVVDAPVETRIRRLVDHRGLAESDARARIAAQADDDARRAAADIWLSNAGTPDETRAAVDALWTDRLAPYEENTRLRRPFSRGAPRVVDYDLTWPAQAERLLARLRLAVGPAALRVDHIGSTSVPGLAAKDILDFQVVVPTLDDSLAEPLSAAGFPRAHGFDSDIGHPPGSPETPKHVHVGVDPGRWANVHVRAQDSPFARISLLFPAWLRADDSARAEYAQVKRGLAGQHANIPAYGDAKEPWFDGAIQRAERWAAATGWRAD
ncbi:dephospho-CoA kinase [Actinokineospora globicatena]|uniref:dephospho-CoA kinase n=1 Tax=Actinokineospora globicatena TaxID=103729 RepID=UPI0020A31683|nr:dephospho-CoA kinase [Actinokineospora globicatena]MCP2304623.1 dephospho-CoA kinase [Actinokineospora globicatena]GLW78005.1 dephospho-CoA kinase [Actinokineospora globicatena]GLW85329.1 dephospho-CoA kinase [Actinokineospora globicatena]